ncbi:unnamed protein product [Amoebophrya sp. A25]|nr:unnamed protein product [Amoebophrya sp. A25]|eukprot:GSA25T00024335001.1
MYVYLCCITVEIKNFDILLKNDTAAHAAPQSPRRTARRRYSGRTVCRCRKRLRLCSDGSETVYRSALEIARAMDFRAHRCDAVMQLGDLVDGKARSHYGRAANAVAAAIEESLSTSTSADTGQQDDGSPQESSTSTEANAKALERFDIVGNHELYCAPRSWWSRSFWLPPKQVAGHQENDAGDGQKQKVAQETAAAGQQDAGEQPDEAPNNPDSLYYSLVVAGGRWRLIVLDAYIESLYGYDDFVPTQDVSPESSSQQHPMVQRARAILAAENPQVLRGFDNPKGNFDYFEGVPLEQQRFCPYNGAFGARQRAWLKAELDAARAAQQFACIFSHIPVMATEEHGGWRTLAWDTKEVLELLEPYAEDTLVAFYGGHRHRYAHMEKDGIQHVVLSSPMVQPEKGESAALLDFNDDGSILQTGFGMPSISVRNSRVDGNRR